MCGSVGREILAVVCCINVCVAYAGLVTSTSPFQSDIYVPVSRVRIFLQGLEAGT